MGVIANQYQQPDPTKNISLTTNDKYQSTWIYNNYYIFRLFRRPGQSQGLLYKHLRHLLGNSLIFQSKYIYGHATANLLKMGLSVIKLLEFQEILSLEGHQTLNTRSGVTTILLNGWVFPVGGVAACTAGLFLYLCLALWLFLKMRPKNMVHFHLIKCKQKHTSQLYHSEIK